MTKPLAPGLVRMHDGIVYEVQPTPGATFDGIHYHQAVYLVQVEGPVEHDAWCPPDCPLHRAPSEMIPAVNMNDPHQALRAALADEEAKVRIYPPGAVAALLEQRDAYREALDSIASQVEHVTAPPVPLTEVLRRE